MKKHLILIIAIVAFLSTLQNIDASAYAPKATPTPTPSAADFGFSSGGAKAGVGEAVISTPGSGIPPSLDEYGPTPAAGTYPVLGYELTERTGISIISADVSANALTVTLKYNYLLPTKLAYDKFKLEVVGSSINPDGRATSKPAIIETRDLNTASPTTQFAMKSSVQSETGAVATSGGYPIDSTYTYVFLNVSKIQQLNFIYGDARFTYTLNKGQNMVTSDSNFLNSPMVTGFFTLLRTLLSCYLLIILFKLFLTIIFELGAAMKGTGGKSVGNVFSFRTENGITTFAGILIFTLTFIMIQRGFFGLVLSSFSTIIGFIIHVFQSFSNI